MGKGGRMKRTPQMGIGVVFGKGCREKKKNGRENGLVVWCVGHGVFVLLEKSQKKK